MNTENSTRSESATPGRGDALEDVRTVVVKVGTNVLSRPGGDMALGRIHGLIENLADLRRRGIKVILVSSGAISMGMNRLEYDKRPTSLQAKQACAADVCCYGLRPLVNWQPNYATSAACAVDKIHW